MAWCISNNKLTLFSRKIAISNINSNTLLTLSLQTIYK
ncbi:Uncharacterised protein [Klebsiella pneumoniae]|nr:Uncharacterised protein [Klebsiella pneumoniae]SYR78277.1 Uncharacterised protein [Klebsiella pneumoniae]